MTRMDDGRRKPVPASEAARLYRLGLTMGEIAGIYQVSAWVIASRLDQAGVRRRTPGTRRSLYHGRHLSYAALGANPGVHLVTVIRAVRLHAIPPSQPGHKGCTAVHHPQAEIPPPTSAAPATAASKDRTGCAVSRPR